METYSIEEKKENSFFSFLASKKAIVFALYAMALVPFIVSEDALFPYIFSKISFIRGVSFLTLLLLSFYLYKNRNSKERMIEWDKLNNPLFIALSIFIGVVLLGSLFGVNFYRSFFGDIERGMGILTMLYGLLYAGLLLIFFGKREWLNFFKIFSISSLLLYGDAIKDSLFYGVYRPSGVFINNPAFVAVYALFIIFAAWIIIDWERGSRLWRSFSWLIIGLSGWVLIITKTRGVFVGIIVAIIFMAAWMISSGRGEVKIPYIDRKISYKRVGAFVISSVFLATLGFMATRSNPIWQNIPGLDRLAQISSEDNSTQSRIINTFAGFDAVNPVDNGVSKLLFGWGQEHFGVAYEANVDPEIQKYEIRWFDRAHNQLMDVLVMNGVLGLLAYLYLWFAVVRKFLRRERQFELSNSISLAVIFFASSYFMQNLFLFDQISAFVPIYTFFGFSAYLTRKRGEGLTQEAHYEQKSNKANLAVYGLAILSFYLFIWLTAIPLNQMKIITRSLRDGDFTPVVNGIEKISHPYNYAQEDIRYRALTTAVLLYREPLAKDFILRSVELLEESDQVSMLRAKPIELIGYTYNSLGKFYSDEDLLDKGEEHLRRLVEMSPYRQEVYNLLATNLILQGQFDEAKDLIIKAIDMEPDGLRAHFYYLNILMPYDWHNNLGTMEYFNKKYVDEGMVLTAEEVKEYRNSYSAYMDYFLRVKDAESFEKMMEQAIIIEETIKEVNEKQFSEGLIVAPFDNSQLDNLRNGLTAFRVRGWEAIERQRS